MAMLDNLQLINIMSAESRWMAHWYLDERGRIDDIRSMSPGRSDFLYRSPGPVFYALVVNRGWFDRHGAQVGDVVPMPAPSAHYEGRDGLQERGQWTR